MTGIVKTEIEQCRWLTVQGFLLGPLPCSLVKNIFSKIILGETFCEHINCGFLLGHITGSLLLKCASKILERVCNVKTAIKQWQWLTIDKACHSVPYLVL